MEEAVKHLLHVGNAFRCAIFGDLARVDGLKHASRWEGGVLLRDDKVLVHEVSAVVHWTRTEKRSDGWERVTEETLDLRPNATDLGTRVWLVRHVSLKGGGTGHGPHDVYENGHHVIAMSDDRMHVHFFQTGCFRGVVAPEQIELVNGEDAPGTWVQRYEYAT